MMRRRKGVGYYALRFATAVLTALISFILNVILTGLSNALAAGITFVSAIVISIVAVALIVVSVVLQPGDEVKQKGSNLPGAAPQALPRNCAATSVAKEGKPGIEQPALLCLAVDVSHSMRDSLIVRTGDLIRQRTDLRTVFEHFVDLSIACVQDPATQRVLPLYYLMVYGFGFKEMAKAFALRRKAGGAARDWLSHPTLPELPSASDIYEHRNEYKDHMLSARNYTLDFFGSSPMYQALTQIKERIQKETGQRTFALPILLTIISDGVSGDGDPQTIIDELHNMGVMTLCCYVAKEDVLAAKKLYDTEDTRWPEGAKLLFRCASPLYKDSYMARAMYSYLVRTGWHPRQGVRLFTQVNQAEALDRFLNILLSGLVEETEE